ncbi:hypothetical protein GLOIN_2v1839589 [Rhizophagus clarus]|uniref:Uncharacterized protein n=1 Tax=Rhizophagus clarus TaxID=94130 RepID=A0A8H3M2C0_9GLOM|nr:hypothetical protein GLOIN_2v1839589 [Rhizophagus clarus]
MMVLNYIIIRTLRLGIQRKYDEAVLFKITNSYVQQKLEELSKSEKNKNLIVYMSDDWKNIDILNLIFERNIKAFKFSTILFQIYPNDYQFQEKELGVWRAIFHVFGCTNIILFAKKYHTIKFWTKTPNPSSVRNNLAKLFELKIY